MARTSSDQNQQFNTVLITLAIIAAILALSIVWLVYGCARQTNNKPKLEKPGMYLTSLPGSNKI